MNEILEIIKNAIKGKDVRMALHDAMKKLNDQEVANYEKYNQMVINAGNSNAEIVDARGSYEKLDIRLDDIDRSLNNVIIKDDFAVLEGKFTLNINSQENITSGDFQETQHVIDFPDGYNKNNCVCISFGQAMDSIKLNYCYGYGPDNDIFSIQKGSIPRSILLGQGTLNNKIMISGYNNMPSVRNFCYKVVLMKIR